MPASSRYLAESPMGSNWRKVIAWLVVLALPWQALMAVTLDIQGPAHHHAPAARSDSHGDGNISAAQPLMLPRDFSSAASNIHQHTSTQRHHHAGHGENAGHDDNAAHVLTAAHVDREASGVYAVIIDDGDRNSDLLDDMSPAGGFGSVFATMVPSAKAIIALPVRDCWLPAAVHRHASCSPAPLERPPRASGV